MDLIDLVKLGGFAHRYPSPSQLSGGQRQRVALARALAIEPRVLLLDEPFGALDAKVRKELRRWLRQLHDEMGLTSVFVTHDQEEALEVADEVVILRAGRIEQVGPPDELYDHPVSPFVCEFLGEVSRVPSHLAEGDKVERLSRGLAYVRPEDIELVARGEPGTIPARVVQVVTRGAITKVELEVPGTAGPVQAQLSRARARELQLRSADEVFMRAKNVRVFEPAELAG
jgi:sulfate transport system ATP-binding protein